jgi:hypothetical protein
VRGRLAVAGALLIVALLGSAGSARAGNILVNPSFEADVDANGIPDNWSVTLPGQMARDTSFANTGAASMLTATTAHDVPDVSACVLIGPGMHNASYYYRSTSTPTALIGQFVYFSTTNCTGGGFASFIDLSPPLTDGAWHQVTGSVNFPVGTQSAFVQLGADCATCPAVVYFDDVILDVVPTAVAVASSSAVRTGAAVVVSWTAGATAQVAGFNVYRGTASHRVRLNRRLLVAAGSALSGVYSFRDSRPAKPVLYWIESVGLDGSRTLVGPVHAR